MIIFCFLGVGPPCCSILCQFWLCEEAQCVYLRRHLGSPVKKLFKIYHSSQKLFHQIFELIFEFSSNPELEEKPGVPSHDTTEPVLRCRARLPLFDGKNLSQSFATTHCSALVCHFFVLQACGQTNRGQRTLAHTFG